MNLLRHETLHTDRALTDAPQANHPNWPLRKGKIRNALIQHFICFQALHNHKFAISDGVGEGEMCCFVSHEEIEMSEKIIERERKALMNI